MGKRGMRWEVGARTVIKMRAEEKAHVGNNFFGGKLLQRLRECAESACVGLFVALGNPQCAESLLGIRGEH